MAQRPVPKTSLGIADPVDSLSRSGNVFIEIGKCNVCKQRYKIKISLTGKYLLMRYPSLLFTLIFFCSCWKPYRGNYNELQPAEKVWGSKPVYAALDKAKAIHYTSQKQPIIKAGNIYAFGHYIFQVDVGRGIHVIDNTDPVKADRIGFITVNGCEQVSIKGAYLYTNSYADLVTIDISKPANLQEVSRVPNAFPELGYYYPLAQPEESGYYVCPRSDSAVVGWVKDSVSVSGCYKY